MSQPNTQAHVAFDHHHFGVRIHIRTGYMLRPFDGGPWVTIPEGDARLSQTDEDRTTLRLTEEEARALYDALGDYLGHAGASTQALRRDYDAERKRVDRFIDHLTGKATR